MSSNKQQLRVAMLIVATMLAIVVIGGSAATVIAVLQAQDLSTSAADAGSAPLATTETPHYTLLVGYDDVQFTVMDAFNGGYQKANTASMESYWREFNRLYLMVFPVDKTAVVDAILGDRLDDALLHSDRDFDPFARCLGLNTL